MTENEKATRRVLIVEDEALIAFSIEDMLVELGYEVAGSAASVVTALKLANESEFDMAILDVTIRGGKTYPVAEALDARGIPYLFASGYGDWALPEKLRNRPRLMKPFVAADLEREIGALCRGLDCSGPSP